jgi:hypothetical protein
MPRKTTVNTTKRSKKTGNSVTPATMQGASEVSKNSKPSNPVPFNLEEEIRRRAYELYLQRRAIAGSGNGNGNENQDWLVAEQEIRSRHNGQGHHTA